MENNDRIWASKLARKKLKEQFDAGDAVVSEALRFRHKNRRSREIRSYAVNVLHCPLFISHNNVL